MSPEVKKIINKIAKELDIPVLEAEKAYEAPFELQAIIMKYRCDREKKIFPSLRIPYFLIFYCPDWHKKRMLKKELKDSTNEIDRLS